MKSVEETEFYEDLEFDIARLKERIAKIAGEIAVLPQNISWGNMTHLFSARAEYMVLETVRSAVANGEKEKVINYLNNISNSALRGGFSISSNPVSNILDRDLAEAWYRMWVDEGSSLCKKHGLIKAYEEVEN